MFDAILMIYVSSVYFCDFLLPSKEVFGNCCFLRADFGAGLIGFNFDWTTMLLIIELIVDLFSEVLSIRLTLVESLLGGLRVLRPDATDAVVDFCGYLDLVVTDLP